MPAFSMVTVNEDTVQTPVVLDVIDTERPEVAVGETVKVDADHGRSVGGVNVIDCDACEMVKLRETELAALK